MFSNPTYSTPFNILSGNGHICTYDETWGDLLTSYDGQVIFVDSIGNPVNASYGATIGTIAGSSQAPGLIPRH